MRGDRFLALAALAAALATPAAADFDLSGTLGGGYRRIDDWVLDDHAASTLWDWYGTLNLSGSPIRPELMQLRLGGAYVGQANLYGGTTTRWDYLTFLGNVSLLSHAVSPVAVNLGASLQNADFTARGTDSGTGSTRTAGYSGGLGFQAENLPTVQLFASRTEATNRSFGAPETEFDTTYLSASARQTLSNHAYGLFYETSWNDGTYADTNYRTHRARLDLSSDVSKDVRFLVTETYYLRLPTLDSPLNPRYDDNSLQLGVQWVATPRQDHRFNYRYARQVADFSASPDREVSAQGLQYLTDYRMTPDLTLGAVAAVDYAVERQGAAEQKAASQSLLGTLDWRYRLPDTRGDALRFALALGGGALEPSGGGAEASFTVRGRAGWETSATWMAGSVTYEGTYQSNTGGRSGWSTSHLVYGDGTVQLGPQSTLRGQTTLSLSITDSDFFGRTETRSATFYLIYALGAWSSQLVGGLNQGLGTALEGASLLPRDFSSTSKFLSLRFVLPLVARLSLTTDARISGTSGPGRPTLVEKAASVLLGYSIGLWTVSLDERYSTAGAGGYDRSGNYLMIRISRTFGARF